MAGGHQNHWTGEIAHAWVTQDGVCRVLVKDQNGKHWTSEPIIPHGLDAESLVGRRVRRLDGRWVLAEQQGIAA